MYKQTVFGFVTVLALTLAGCGGGSDPAETPHNDTLTLAIDTNNALAIAAEVYRVVAVDVPYTASVAMAIDPGTGAMIVNSAACVDPNALSDGGAGGMMGMAMDMVFNSCELASTPLNSAHTLVINGRCTNNGTGVETVTGDMISLTKLGTVMETVTLHAFSVTRNSDQMTNASGFLHGLVGGMANVVRFSTPTPFSGSAMVPETGRLLIRGANKSRLRLSIVNATDFTLEVDAGGGTYEYLQTPAEQNWNNIFWSSIP